MQLDIQTQHTSKRYLEIAGFLIKILVLCHHCPMGNKQCDG